MKHLPEERHASPQLIAQRLRNRIIESLENWISTEEMHDYQKGVPNVHVPYEMINQFYDFYDEGWLDQKSLFSDPSTLTPEEVSATVRFDEVLSRLIDHPIFDEPLEKVLESGQYHIVSAAAKTCLAVYSQHGKMSETEEIATYRKEDP